MTLKKQPVRIALGLLLALFFLGHAAKVYQIPLLVTLDAFVYDARIRLTAPGGVDERIVILDIDEKSLSEVGRWPWSRDKLSTLVNQLFDRYHIAALGFDVVFAESDDSSGLVSLERMARNELKDDPAFQAQLPHLRKTLDYDRQFADALRGRPIVLGYYLSVFEPPRKSGVLPAPVFPAGTFAGKDIVFTSWTGYAANLPEFQKSTGLAGHFNPFPDPDGISRRVPMLVEHEGQYYEALSLAMARLLLGSQSLIPGYPEQPAIFGKTYQAMEWLDLPTGRVTVRIPVDENVSALIPYRGAQGSFRYLPAVDVLTGRAEVEELRNKIVLLGTATPGLMDLRATPVGSAYPGVEIHASLLAGLLDGSIKQKPLYVRGLEVVLILLCTLVLAVFLPVLSPMKATLLASGALLAVVSLNFTLWVSGFVVPLASTVIVIGMVYVFNMAWGYFVESQSKRLLAERFGQYVPPELVDEMARDPERYSMEGRSAELTVLFSDIRDFTSLSEALEPKQLAAMMNEYFGAMTQVVREQRGTLDKYIGDAIMAFWGAPLSDAEHARRAVLAALDMQQALRRLDERFKAQNWPILRIGIGINSGSMIVGDMGSAVRKSYTVVGDPVNLASRLEGATKHYRVGIIAGEATRNQVKDVAWRELDRVRVKGKEQPTAIYEPLGLLAELNKAAQDELKLWNQVLRLYRAQDWDQAELQLYNLSRSNPDCALYGLYVERIAHHRVHPPGEGWNGVTTFDVK